LQNPETTSSVKECGRNKVVHPKNDSQSTNITKDKKEIIAL